MEIQPFSAANNVCASEWVGAHEENFNEKVNNLRAQLMWPSHVALCCGWTGRETDLHNFEIYYHCKLISDLVFSTLRNGIASLFILPIAVARANQPYIILHLISQRM